MAHLELRNVHKNYGTFAAVNDLSMKIEDGCFTVFVGPSGCGKSTLLRMIAGLEEISGGELLLDGRVANGETPTQRGIAMVFQNYALYPHMSVEKNIGFGLRMSGASRPEITEKVGNAAHSLKLDQLMQRKPSELSGGQRQRVAIGRAIVRDPQVFLFDEPLSNLDAELRVSMRLEIARLHKQLNTTMIYVTHDQTEAMTLADQIAVLNDGKIEQIGSPETLYTKPANTFVAGFIGSPRMNMLSGMIDGSIVDLGENGKITLPASLSNLDMSGSITIGFRPEDTNFGMGEPGFELQITVETSEYLGGNRYIYGRTESGELVTIESRSEQTPLQGERLSISVNPASLHFFDEHGQRVESEAYERH